METTEDIMEKLRKDALEEAKEELTKNAGLIENFKKICRKSGIELQNKNFRYLSRIGIVASYPKLLPIINPNLSKDKDGLILFRSLDKHYDKNGFATGMLYSEDYIAFAHPYFRRGFYEANNYAPHFVGIFWGMDEVEFDFYIALDENMVRINVDQSVYMEMDTWFGAKFDKQIENIEDGIVKVRPPLDVDESTINFLFKDAYSLDIKWSTNKNIKTFQAEELKTASVKIIEGEDEFYPVRYIHAEYDLENGHFRHFDGAIHLYTHDEYLKRKDSDLNFNAKNNSHIKTKSTKLFKLNGKVSVDKFIELTSHFFTGNPLILEYFEGKYPDHVTKALERMRNRQ